MKQRCSVCKFIIQEAGFEPDICFHCEQRLQREADLVDHHLWNAWDKDMKKREAE